MKAIALAKSPFEQVTQKEIREILGKDSEIEKNAVLFSADYFDLCRFAYKAQSVSRVLILLENGPLNSVNDLDKIKKSNFNSILKDFFEKDTTFLVRCKKQGDYSFSTGEIETKLGEIIYNKLQSQKLNADVNAKNPDVLFFIYIINNKFYFGIDISGFDLSKRDYKIFSSTSSIKGTVAYSLLRLANYKKKDILLDTFPKSGEIAIEAALFLGEKSPNFYRKDEFIFTKQKPFQKKYKNADDFFKKIENKKEQAGKKTKTKKSQKTINCFDENLKYIKSIQKNAKIAGVLDKINISKVSAEWLDTKFDKGTVNKFVSVLPMFSKKTDKTSLEKLYKELFYQLEYILDEKSTIAVLTNSKETTLKYAVNNKFKLKKEFEFKPGEKSKIVLYVMLFSKNQ